MVEQSIAGTYLRTRAVPVPPELPVLFLAFRSPSLARRFLPLSDWLIFGLLALMPCAIAGRPLIEGAIPDFMDPVMYFFPLRWHAAQLLHDGQLPWWSRSILTGVPLFSNPQAALAYPPHAFMLAWPSGLAWTLPLLLHLGLYAASTWALLRGVGLRFISAFMGGALCLAGAYGWTRLQMGNYMNVLPWWPLWVLAFLGFCRSGRAPALTGGALTVAMMILAGAHQLAVYGALGLALLLLPSLALGEERARGWIFALGSAFLGLLIAAPGWLPQLAFLAETGRAQDLQSRAVLVGTLASPLEGVRHLVGGSTDAGSSLSVGAFALLVAGVMPPAGRRRLLWTGAWIAGGVTFLLAWKPVAALMLERLPGFAAFHDPKRILGVTQWLLILAAALGADGLLAPGDDAPGRRWFRALPVLAVGALLALALRDIPLTWRDAAVPVALVFILLFLTWPSPASGATPGLNRARGGAAALFILAAVGLLAWESSQTVPFSWRSADDLVGEGPPPLLKTADLKPGERFFAVDWKRDFSYDFRRPDLRKSALPNLAMLWDVEDIGGYEPARTARYDRWRASAAPWPGNRQPWSAHFGLPWPPRDNAGIPESFGEANPKAALLPRWGVPVYLTPIEEGRLAGLAPPWNADLTAHLLYRPAPREEGLHRLRTLDVLGARRDFDFDPADALTAMEPVIDTTASSPTPSGLELDSSLKTQVVDLSGNGDSGPLAGIELEIPPANRPAWLFLWSEPLKSLYTPVRTDGLQLLAKVTLPGEWAELRPAREGGHGDGRILSHEIEANRVDLRIEWNGTGPGIVEIRDAWWPGWKAWVDGAPAGVRPSGPDGRGLWRWIEVPPGESSVVLTYEPPLLRASLTASSAGFLLLLLTGWLVDRRNPPSRARR